MAHVGSLALILALGLALVGTVSAFIAAYLAKERFRRVAVRAFIGASILILTAVVVLGYLLQNDRFEVVYVQSHSNAALPWFFKLTAIWGGHQGSLLWWTLILAVFTCCFLLFTRKAPKLMISWALAIIGLNLVFFLVINNIVAPPFQTWSQVLADGSAQTFRPTDGRGLNPQLQHWAMIIHPPMLYTGYIAFLFPFAMALGALITRMEGREWIHMIRRWTLTAWIILGSGIILGGAWAYMELGWGGYWAWDPVENASFMPWLLGTAFIHSVMAQEKRGMFKLWNILLVIGAYIMCLVGTFITRSGLISSVHSFAKSDIGYYFIGFILLLLVLSFLVLLFRRDQLVDDNRYDSFMSREVGLLFNNVLFVAFCVTTLVGTFYPILTEALEGVKRETPRHLYYEPVSAFIFFSVIILMSFGPMLAWKHTTNRMLRERFLWPTVAAILVLITGLIVNKTSLTATLSAAALSFLGVVILHEFIEVAIRRSKRASENLLRAFLNVVRMNKRRYGGLIAHFSVLLIGIGITGSAFNQQGKEELGVGEVMTVGRYTFQIEDIGISKNDNYESMWAKVNLLENGSLIRSFKPEQRYYFASESQASEIGIGITALRDYYIVLAGPARASTKEHMLGVFHVYVNPLVVWIWAGGLLLAFATFICLLPDKARVAARESSAFPAVGEPV